MPEIVPGQTTVTAFEAALGPPRTRSDSQIVWHSLLELRPERPCGSPVQAEVPTCQFEGDTVQRCAAETQWTIGQPKGTPYMPYNEIKAGFTFKPRND